MGIEIATLWAPKIVSTSIQNKKYNVLSFTLKTLTVGQTDRQIGGRKQINLVNSINN